MPEITQEEYDESMKQISILKFQQQKHQDTLESGITSRNLASFRNTYVINAQDSLDADYPMYVHFNIIKEMIKIVSVKVSFWILNYRAYSKAGAAGGGQTSSSGGGQTTSSGGGSILTSSSGGGQTSAVNNRGHGHNTTIADLAGGTAVTLSGTVLRANTGLGAVDVPTGNPNQTHTHTVANHIHTVSIPNHTHTVADHTHTVADHTHDAVYGIFEEDTSPTIKFYVSENEGVSYNDIFFGGYTTKKSDLEITSLLTGTGSKLIKFESDVRARLSVQIEIKLDIKAR